MPILLAAVALLLLAGCAVAPAGKPVSTAARMSVPVDAPDELDDRYESPPSVSAPVAASSVVPPGWQAWPLPGKRATAYEVAQVDGRAAVHARSEASASMLRRKLLVEPADLGVVSYSWRVPALIAQADLTQRETEDSPVRVVLAFDGDHRRLGFKDRSMFDLAELVTGERPPFATLMYVWENRAAPETVIVNPRTDRIRKIVVESGDRQLDRWLSYQRNIAADYRRAFGEEPGRLIGIALMTDSDNTQSRTEAWYGPVELSPATPPVSPAR